MWSMTDAEKLATLLKQRRLEGADRTAIDASIYARFGQVHAVMYTDLVGFSRVVETFGILHFLELIQESETLFLPLIHRHGGVCIKREGDSLLVLFDTPQRALVAAHAMVQVTVEVNPGRAPEDRIEVCIGLGYGTVLRIDGNEVWGAEVNAASKLGEDLAKGGEVLVTDSFRGALPQEPFVECGVLFGKRHIYRFSPEAG
jgi:class 3 adenylate cyclase